VISNEVYEAVLKALRNVPGVPRDRIEDVVQDASVELLQQIAEGYVCADVGKLLYRMAQHRLGREFKALTFERANSESLNGWEHYAPNTVPVLTSSLADTGRRKELLQDLVEVLEGVPSEVRDTLLVLRECSVSETARRLSVTRQTVYNRLRKAKAIASRSQHEKA
jgi:DNA-directed RNA polymerase specialized sigma24 family protein